MKVIANCKVCNTLLVGEGLHKIGSSYYCEAHYSIEQDKPTNRRTYRLNKRMDKLTEPFANLIDTDFTNWTSIDITVDGKELST